MSNILIKKEFKTNFEDTKYDKNVEYAHDK